MSKYDQIQTGDVVLLSSITTFAIIVKWTNFTEFNHVAVAVRIRSEKLPEIKVVKTGGTLCLIEFNGDDFKNVLTGQIHHGNRLVLLDDIIAKYKRISYRRLHHLHYSSNFNNKIKDFIKKYCNTIIAMDMITPTLNTLFRAELKDQTEDKKS